MNFAQSALKWIINNLLTDSQLDVHVFGCKYSLREWIDQDKFRKDQEIIEAKLELADIALELDTIAKRFVAGEHIDLTDISSRRAALVSKLKEMLHSV